jgi:hypothetical protein
VAATRSAASSSDCGNALRALVSRGMVEQVEQEHKPKAKAKRGKR